MFPLNTTIRNTVRLTDDHVMAVPI